MYFLTFYFCIPVPYNENTSFIDLVLEALLVFIEPLNFSFFSITGWGINLDYCDTDSVIFEIIVKKWLLVKK